MELIFLAFKKKFTMYFDINSFKQMYPDKAEAIDAYAKKSDALNLKISRLTQDYKENGVVKVNDLPDNIRIEFERLSNEMLELNTSINKELGLM
jgi:hypothetical protein